MIETMIERVVLQRAREIAATAWRLHAKSRHRDRAANDILAGLNDDSMSVRVALVALQDAAILGNWDRLPADGPGAASPSLTRAANAVHQEKKQNPNTSNDISHNEAMIDAALNEERL